MENGDSGKKYQPFDYFVKKKSDENLDIDELKSLWNELSDRKKLKYIRKAESAFDADHEDADEINKSNCFATFISNEELKILLDAYNYPAELPEGLKHFYILKHGDSAESLEAFSKFGIKEKEDLYNDMTSAKEEYYRQYIAFLDSLPQRRHYDYRRYVNPVCHYKLPPPKAKIIKKKTPVKEKKLAKKEKDETLKQPWEFYFDKHQARFMQHETKEYYAKLKARSEYKTLDDKKKLKFIRKCEAYFDEYHEDDGAQLHKLLNRDELRLLFDAYGMPKVIPPNFYSFYTTVHYNEYYGLETGERFKAISEAYKNLSDSEKNEVREQHQKARDEYSEKHKQFVSNLPPQRLEDYKVFHKRTAKPTTTAATDDDGSLNGSKHANDTTSNLGEDDDSENESIDFNPSSDGGGSPKKMRK